MTQTSYLLSTQRIPAVDGLRGLAILLVLLGHFFAATIAVPADSIWIYVPLSLRLSWSGVDLFFVLSGFLIGGILLDNRTATNYFKVFYLRRACRIFPLYYLLLLIFFALVMTGAARFSPWLFDKPLPALAYLTFTQNFWSVWFVAQVGYPAYWPGVTWSLAIEEQFYIISSLVIRRTQRWLPHLLIGFILLAPILRTIFYLTVPLGSLISYLCLPMRADAPLLGVLLAYLWRQPNAKQWLMARRNSIKAVLLLLLTGLVGLNIGRQELAVSGSSVMTTIGYSWVALFYVGILFLVLAEPFGWLARCFCLQPLSWLGQISYGAYLIHIPILGLFHAFAFGKAPAITNRQELLITFGAFLTTLLTALFSWHYFEKPIIHWGRLHQYQPAGELVAPTVSN